MAGADGTSRASALGEERGPMKRRSSVSRAWTRFRNALKRKFEDRRATVPVSTAAWKEERLSQEGIDVDQRGPLRNGTDVNEPAWTSYIAVDDEPHDDDDEYDLSLLAIDPTQPSSREARSRALLAKYGIDTTRWRTAPASDANEPAPKIRRIERSIHMRTHWTCHECTAIYARQKTCPACGHRQCYQCTRSPSSRVRDTMDCGVKQIPNQEETNTKQSDQPDIPPSQPDLPLSTPDETEPAISALPPATFTDLDDEGFMDDPHHHPSPRRLVPRLIDRQWPLGDDGDDEAVFAAPVRQRVYRQTRQRVHWVCHECRTTFVDRTAGCRTCGHRRCGSCERYPPRRTPLTPDPAVAQAVAEKLAQLPRRAKCEAEASTSAGASAGSC